MILVPVVVVVVVVVVLLLLLDTSNDNDNDSDNDKFEMGKIRMIEGENGPEVCNVKNQRKEKNKTIISVRKSKVIENDKMERKYRYHNG